MGTGPASGTETGPLSSCTANHSHCVPSAATAGLVPAIARVMLGSDKRTECADVGKEMKSAAGAMNGGEDGPPSGLEPDTWALKPARRARLGATLKVI